MLKDFREKNKHLKNKEQETKKNEVLERKFLTIM